MNEALPETLMLIADMLICDSPFTPPLLVPLPLMEALQSGPGQVAGPRPPQDPIEMKHSDLAKPPPVRRIPCAEAVCKRPVKVPPTAIAISQVLIVSERLSRSVRREAISVKDNR